MQLLPALEAGCERQYSGGGFRDGYTARNRLDFGAYRCADVAARNRKNNRVRHPCCVRLSPGGADPLTLLRLLGSAAAKAGVGTIPLRFLKHAVKLKVE